MTIATTAAGKNRSPMRKRPRVGEKKFFLWHRQTNIAKSAPQPMLSN